MPGTLYVVATPIGNLEDVTLRALRILRDVSLIAAEDTRRTSRLLQHYSISTPTTSLHEHNERQKSRALIARLLAGESVALVSDAGTPLISDPGQDLVATAREAGVRVEPIPGPSAVIAAIAAAGIPAGEFTFVGFPPARSKARIEWLRRIADEPRLIIFYEAPHRFQATMRELQAIVGERLVGVARELTKTHEELVIQPINLVLTYFSDPKGEFTVLLAPARTPGIPKQPVTEAELTAEVGHLMETTALPRREAMRRVGERHGLSPNEVYRLLEQRDK
jgi:16S rRNA (cytidine1402-2'-O)-methyltransferase